MNRLDVAQAIHAKAMNNPRAPGLPGKHGGYLYTIADNKGSPTNAPAPAFSTHHTERSGASAYSLRLSLQNAEKKHNGRGITPRPAH